MVNYKFYFFAFAAYGEGISGGDRIFIELARNWSRSTPVTIFVTPEGAKMCERQNLSGKYLTIKTVGSSQFQTSFLLNYIYRIFLGLYIGSTLRLRNNSRVYLYSASEFWMDSIPAILLKLRNTKSKWVAAWYQTAPNLFTGFSEGERDNKYNKSAFLYWAAQLPIKPLISKFADSVIVNNESEKKQFLNLAKRGRALVLIGAVKLDEINLYKKNHKKAKKIYGAVFQGRFHPQKGVEELIDIWKIVVSKNPEAKLAMIGDGPLMQKVKTKIENLKLQNNIISFGYVFDGGKKYKIFSQSKLVVHPAFFDSGGMASAEAMAFGLPCVGFDLKAYKSYYPQGMAKVPVGDLDALAKEILKMLKSNSYRNQIGRQALNMIRSNWSWKNRSEDILRHITK